MCLQRDAEKTRADPHLPCVSYRRNLSLHYLPIRAYPGPTRIFNTSVIARHRREDDIPGKSPTHSRSPTDESLTHAKRSDTHHQPFCAILPGILGDHPRHDSLCWRFVSYLRYPEATYAHLDSCVKSTQDLVGSDVRSRCGCVQSDSKLSL